MTPQKASPATAYSPHSPSTTTSLVLAYLPQSVRSLLSTVLSSPDSRRIFYFLLLNLVYLFIQLAYGFFTNSLGLISDAVHMAFDCVAISVGLGASVMAKWERSPRWTWGYERVQVVSGFVNGVVLVLISVFISFEAVQRM